MPTTSIKISQLILFVDHFSLVDCITNTIKEYAVGYY